MRANRETPTPRLLTALPVFNEEKHLNRVLDEVARHVGEVLVVDDGSTDGTAELLAARDDVRVATHPKNRGYGAALRTAFCYARRNGYDLLVTIDCDGQHEPQRIQQIAELCTEGIDIVSGSRYLDRSLDEGEAPPEDRRRINHTVTQELNDRLGLELTDAFCGFKAYRVASLAGLRLTEDGYAMPLELWVQAAHQSLRIVEAPVPLIYLEEERSFGGGLDDARRRLTHYRKTIDRAVIATQRRQAAPSEADDPCAGLISAAAPMPAVS